MRQPLLFDMPTARAGLRRVLGIHLDDHTTGPFSLVVEHRVEQRPSRVGSRKREVPIGNHKARRYVFDGDTCKGFRHAVGQSVQIVLALVGDLAVQRFDAPFALPPARRKARLTCQGPLCPSQLGQRPTQPARVVNQRSVREGQQAVQSHVNADSLALGALRCRLGAVVALEADEPFASLAGEDDVLETSFGNSPMPLNLDLADVLDVERVPRELAAITVPVLNRAVALRWLEARKARRLVILETTEEGGKRLVETAQKLLNGRCVEQSKVFQPRLAILAEAFPLRGVADGLPGVLVHIASVFECLVIQQAGLAQNYVQRIFLLLVGVEAILVRALHSDTFLRFDVAAHRFVRDLSNAAGIVRARPQRRQPRLERRNPCSEFVRGVAFEVSHELVDGHRRRSGNEQMYVIGTNRQRKDFNAQRGRLGVKRFVPRGCNVARQDAVPILGTPNEMILNLVGAACRFAFVCHPINLHKGLFTISHLMNLCLISFLDGQTPGVVRCPPVKKSTPIPLNG